ncbi:PmeII family type II restriction endonuclease [Pedobacter sp. BG31]|uniref:PmeII family type II restriction endonuclease n=1 Tax=Pedobacter sp. BG31 TaxID=3349697 RepID=UPI0035F30A4A
MNKLNLADVTKYIEDNIPDSHQKRLATIDKIKLSEVLKKKNPYLFKAKNVNTASEIIEGILSTFLSSREEGIFGNWLRF